MADEKPADEKTADEKAALTPAIRPSTMPRKIQKKPFLVVSERETAALENTVSKLIMQGYHPHGSMVIQIERDEAYFYQTMVLASALK